MSKQFTIDDLFGSVAECWNKAEQTEAAAKVKGDGKRVEAGRMLLELERRIDGGELGPMTFWKEFNRRFAGLRSERDARRLMAMARAPDPEAARAEEKAGWAAAKASSRSKAKKPSNTKGRTDKPDVRPKSSIPQQDDGNVVQLPLTPPAIRWDKLAHLEQEYRELTMAERHEHHVMIRRVDGEGLSNETTTASAVG